MRLLPVLAMILAALSVGACAGPPAPEGTVLFDGPRPAITETGGPNYTVTAIVNVDRDALLDWIIFLPPESIFDDYGGVKAVSRTELITPEWGKPNSRRRVVLVDGHQAAEEILSIVPGERFTYQVWGFTNSAGKLADYAIGEFVVADHPEGTQLTWTYTFTPRNGLSVLPLSIFVSGDWAGFMNASIGSLKAAAEAELAAKIAE